MTKQKHRWERYGGNYRCSKCHIERARRINKGKPVWRYFTSEGDIVFDAPLRGTVPPCINYDPTYTWGESGNTPVHPVTTFKHCRCVVEDDIPPQESPAPPRWSERETKAFAEAVRRWETSERGAATAQYLRSIVGMEEVAEEIADELILLGQATQMVGVDIVERAFESKLARLEERMKVSK